MVRSPSGVCARRHTPSPRCMSQTLLSNETSPPSSAPAASYRAAAPNGASRNESESAALTTARLMFFRT